MVEARGLNKFLKKKRRPGDSVFRIAFAIFDGHLARRPLDTSWTNTPFEFPTWGTAQVAFELLGPGSPFCFLLKSDRASLEPSLMIVTMTLAHQESPFDTN